jgi:hypothetical protein
LEAKKMNNVYMLILLALVQYMFFTAQVASARAKFGVEAPRITGNDTFERTFRVQQNTLEQLVVFVPGMLLFAWFVSPLWALIPGVPDRRQIYAVNTWQSKKGAGCHLSILANCALLLGALWVLG